MTSRNLTREDGFSLTGTLVVVAVLVVAVLSAAAGPTYMGNKQQTARDVAAQLDARSLVTAVERCYARTRTYTSCDTAGEIRTARFSFGPGAGEVSVTDAIKDDFVVTARSRSGTAFKITRIDGGPFVRTCSAARRGGCAAGGRW